MKKALLIIVIASMGVLEAGSAMARSHGGRGQPMRSCGPYYSKPYSNFETAVAVISAFDMIRNSINGTDSSCTQPPPAYPPICEPQTISYPSYSSTENDNPSGWETDTGAPGQYYEMQ